MPEGKAGLRGPETPRAGSRVLASGADAQTGGIAMAKGKRKKGGRTLAQKADRYELYEKSVQEPEADITPFVAQPRVAPASNERKAFGSDQSEDMDFSGPDRNPDNTDWKLVQAVSVIKERQRSCRQERA